MQETVPRELRTGEWMMGEDNGKQGTIQRKGTVTKHKEKTMWKQTSNEQRGLSKARRDPRHRGKR